MRHLIPALGLSLISSLTFAQTVSPSPAMGWGKSVGINYANAQICGADRDELEAYKTRSLEDGQNRHPQISAYEAEFEKGFAQTYTKVKAAAAASGQPAWLPADNCQQLLEGIRRYSQQ